MTIIIMMAQVSCIDPQLQQSISSSDCTAGIVLQEHMLHLCSCQRAVPSMTTLTTMRCQSCLSSEALMSCVSLTLFFHDLHKLSRYFILWCSSLFFLLLSSHPADKTYSPPIWSHDVTQESKSVAVVIIVRCNPASLNTSSLLVHYTTM